MGDMTLARFGMLMLFVLFSSFGQICMKIGIAGEKIPISRSPAKTVFNILGVMIRPWVLAGLGLYVLGAFTWLVLLSRVRLSVAYPMVSLGYVVVVLLSALVLHEKVKWKYAVAGLVFIALGVSFIGFGMGR